MEFRRLKADEIECRVNTINEDGLTLLLHKTSRTDMNILDETVGAENWQRDHKECKGNLYCGIGIWDKDKSQWIWKWDCGVESAFGDKEKGEASDSFKRAGFNWGIGRELYTSPFIYIFANDTEDKANLNLKKNDNGKWFCNDKFIVEKILYDEKKNITALSIINVTLKKRVYVWQQLKKTENSNKGV